MKHKREISNVYEDYLRAVYSVEEWDEGGIGVTELAEQMGVVPSTASETVRKMREAGLLDHRPYQRVKLTKEGRAIAIQLVRRHRLLETFLHRFLDYSWDEVHEEAEELEHAVSDLFINKIDKALGNPVIDPHGDPIPSVDGSVADSSTATVLSAALDTEYQVVRIRDAEPEVLRHFESRGIVPGARVRVIEKSDVASMLTLLVDGKAVDLPQRLGANIRIISLPAD